VAYFKPKKVLDVGSAKGHLVGELVTRGADAHGIDLSKYAVEHCIEGTRGRLTCGSATQMPYPDKSFDLVVTFDMMEHLSEAQYRAAIKEMGRVASKGVLFSITTEDNVHDKSHVSIMPVQKWIEIIEQEIGVEFYRHKNNFLDQGILWFTPKMCLIYSRKR
jgi:cyclopropane fatty-acyl-phospholipid synthase-like methyltransferase